MHVWIIRGGNEDRTCESVSKANECVDRTGRWVGVVRAGRCVNREHVNFDIEHLVVWIQHRGLWIYLRNRRVCGRTVDGVWTVHDVK